MLVALALTSCKDDFLEVTSPTDTFIEADVVREILSFKRENAICTH